MVDFAGYLMPLQYDRIVNEHNAVRHAAGLFDVSHMGELIVKGKRADIFLDRMTINNVKIMVPGEAQYSVMCRENGGIIDDLLIYRREESFLLVVNAANLKKDFRWLKSHCPEYIKIEDKSDKLGLLALQGPLSRKILNQVTENLSQLSFYKFIEGKIGEYPALIARTGYTGELGFEIYAGLEEIKSIWKILISAGKTAGLKPVGLGCRDTLRMEMKYCLYGNDIDESTNPLEAGLGWITKFDKPDFIGKQALLKAKENMRRRLVCFEMQEKAIPRKDYKLFARGLEIGHVTSGSLSPSLNKGIGLGYAALDYAKTGTEIMVDIRGKMKNAIIVSQPFYKKGSAQI